VKKKVKKAQEEVAELSENRPRLFRQEQETGEGRRDYEEKRRGGVEESDFLLQTMKEGRRGKRRGKGKKWEEFLEIIKSQPTNLTQAGRADPSSRRK